MSTPRPQILIVDDDVGYSDAVAEVLRTEGGYETAQVPGLFEAQEYLSAHDVALVLLDHSLVRGLHHPWDAVADLQALAAPAAVGLSSGWAVPEVEVLARGLAFLLAKPFDLERLLGVVATHAQLRAPSEAEQAVVVAYFAALQEKDWPALGALCTDEVRYHLPGTSKPFCTSVDGRAAFEAFSAETFRQFPEATFAVRAMHCLPSGGVVARYEASWQLPSGERAYLPGSVIFRLADAASPRPRIRELGIRLQVRELLARHQAA